MICKIRTDVFHKSQSFSAILPQSVAYFSFIKFYFAIGDYVYICFKDVGFIKD